MRTELRIVASRDRRPRVFARGGLDARATGPHRLHLIGTAATPLGGDHIDLVVEVEAGAHLQVRAVAATIALPARGCLSSSSRWVLDVADGGCLDFDPAPMVVAGGAEHSSLTVVGLGAGARLRLRERTQLGRSGENGGAFTGELVADADARPLLRHTVSLGCGAVTDDVLDAPRAMVSELVYPDTRPAQFEGLRSARLPLAGGGSLTTWMGARLEHRPDTV
ncbi:urease accessory protein UreD [Aldersonia sp. NBC_00410]|uniref:urease accessory protein UreD n=1 Tax=Aldersonia sp. NBC_00410 TaxID=2975954 RepID=UPI002259A9C2|nr:urease accessory protein UreD [Aldersonia sp. NBC_00410]MCX5044388.1 urease accessory protein UreD [Aldersonia sp. NBC_00410]